MKLQFVHLHALKVLPTADSTTMVPGKFLKSAFKFSQNSIHPSPLRIYYSVFDSFNSCCNNHHQQEIGQRHCNFLVISDR